MVRRLCGSVAPIALMVWCGAASAASEPKGLTLDSVNNASFAPVPESKAKKLSPVVLKAEILLDRARFSPGAIDGLDGENFRDAITAYQAVNGLPVSGHLDQPTWDKLVAADPAPVLTTRKITDEEAKGPFAEEIPAKMEDQADLPRMDYQDLTEKLAEEVHASRALLKTLNHGGIDAGKDLLVPQVVVDRGKPAKVARIVVDKGHESVQAFDESGKLLAFYPASIGSPDKPAPTGQSTIEAVAHNPGYTYNPDYAFKGVEAKKPFKIAPGPNNPVGSVWMSLSIGEGYGIHGTPEPEEVGKKQSHGCVRLTNWDVEDLASMVKKGVVVDFQDEAAPPAQAATEASATKPSAASQPTPAGTAPALQPIAPASATPAAATPSAAALPVHELPAAAKP